MKINLENLAELGLFAELSDEFLDKIKNEIYKKFRSLRNFALTTKILSPDGFTLKFKKGYGKLQFWINCCQFLDIHLDELRDNILKIRSKNPDGGFILPNLLPILPSSELASLVGHALGDGYLHSNLAYFAYNNKSTDLQNEVTDFIYKISGCNKYNESFYKALRRGYPRTVAILLYLAGVLKGNKIIKPFSIPKWILNGSKNIKIHFVRALFDDEGTVKKSHEILFKLSKNENYIDSLYKFMNELKQILEELGIEVTSIRKENIIEGGNGRTIQLVLSIHGYKNFIKFLYDIGFHHKEKQQDLQTLVNSYKNFPLRKGRGQKLVYNKLVKPKTIYTLSEELNISTVSVYKHLKKLQAKNIVEKIEYSRTKPAFWRRLNG